MQHEQQQPGGPASQSEKEHSSGGCCGLLIFLFLLILVGYCRFDKGDFYLAPGEANLWTDAMETVFEDLHTLIPDSLYLADDLNVVARMEDARSIENVIYLINTEVTLRSSQNRYYRLGISADVLHLAPGEWKIRSLLPDTLYSHDPPSAN